MVQNEKVLRAYWALVIDGIGSDIKWHLRGDGTVEFKGNKEIKLGARDTLGEQGNVGRAQVGVVGVR